MKSVILFLVTMLIMVSCGGKDWDTKTYTNEKYSFTMDYPSDWSYEVVSEVEILKLTEPVYKDMDPTVITIEVRDMPEGIKPSVMGAAIYKDMVQNGTDFKEYENKMISEPVSNTMFLNFRLTQFDTKYRYLVYIFAHDGLLYTVTGKTLDERYGEMFDKIDKTIRSIKFQ